MNQGIVVASYLLVAAALLLVMWRGLLPGLLCVCLGFLLTRALTGWFAAGLGRIQRQAAPSPTSLRVAQVTAAGLVMLLPLALLALGLTHSRGYLVSAPQQYQELLTYMARTVLELRLKLPADMASHLPEGVADIQRIIASYLGAKAGALAMAGRAWLAGVLFAYVGLLIGAPSPSASRCLARRSARSWPPSSGSRRSTPCSPPCSCCSCCRCGGCSCLTRRC